jgi:hypothetical protein
VGLGRLAAGQTQPAVEVVVVHLKAREPRKASGPVEMARAASSQSPPGRPENIEGGVGEAAPTAAAPDGPVTGAAQGSGGIDLGRALRTRLGCGPADHFHLSEQEQLACHDRLARGAAQVAALSGVPADKRAAFEAAGQYAPVLGRKAVKGCRPLVTEKIDQVGGQGKQDVTASVSCGTPF